MEFINKFKELKIKKEKKEKNRMSLVGKRGWMSMTFFHTFYYQFFFFILLYCNISIMMKGILKVLVNEHPFITRFYATMSS